MTRKEAIECNKNLKMYMKLADKNQPCKFREENYIALDMAINSLEIDERYELEYENAEEIHREKEQAYMQGYEDACKKYRQESCEDAISRQAVDTLVDELARAISDERCCISRGRSTATIMQDILDLPPVTPQVICPSHGVDCKDCPAYEPKTDVLDKIRAEVCDINDNIVLNPDSLYERKVYVRLIDVVNIIDKYKAESEDKE